MSDRNKRFLEFVVEETLAGRGARLKAYTIATTVFRRGDDFDPQLDPVVRMEAGRLRRAIERFYLLEGHTGPIRIALPKGGYETEFRPAGADAQTGQTGQMTGTMDRSPQIVVHQFDLEGVPSDLLNLNVGFTQQVVIGLHQLGDSVVFISPLVRGLGLTGSVETNDRILTGRVTLVGGTLSATALLFEGSTSRILWGDSFRQNISAGQCILALRDEVAHLVAQAVHQSLLGHARKFPDDRAGTISASEHHRNGATPITGSELAPDPDDRSSRTQRPVRAFRPRR